MKRGRVIFYFIFSFLFCFSIEAKESPLIILDPGHGGKDQGAFVRSLLEKQLTLKTSEKIKSYLIEKGYRVILTRSKDLYLPLHRRVVVANQHPASLFISIHYNSAKATTAQGIEIYYHESAMDMKRAKASRKLAGSVLRHMIAETKAQSRGVKRGNFQVLRDTKVPAILIEAAFLTNEQERARIATEGYLDQLAKGIAEGIDRYLIHS